MLRLELSFNLRWHDKVIRPMPECIWHNHLQSSSLLIFKPLQHRIGIAHLCQWQNFVLREVVHGRSGEKHIKLFVRLYAIDPGTTMTAHNVVATLELSVGLEWACARFIISLAIAWKRMFW